MTAIMRVVFCLLVFLSNAGVQLQALVSSSSSLRQRPLGFSFSSIVTKATAEGVETTPKAPETSATPEKASGDNNENDDKQRRLDLLRDALLEFESPAAAALIQELTELRSQSPDQLDAVIQQLLPEVLLGKGKLPVWTRLPLARRFSQRAKWRSLRNTLDCTTPPPPDSFMGGDAKADDDEESSEAAEDAAERGTRRRRALVTLLRVLAKSRDDDANNDNKPSQKRRWLPPRPAISILEERARREQRQQQRPGGKNPQQMAESLLARRPEGLETPEYDVLERWKVREALAGIEIRRYQPFSLCSVTKGMRTKDQKDDEQEQQQQQQATTTRTKISANAKAFGDLAGYLFGKNQEQTAMKMTTPVLNRVVPQSALTTSAATDDQEDAYFQQQQQQVMSFVLPSTYWGDDGVTAAPQPLAGSGVSLEVVDGQDRAVLMFGGYASPSTTQRNKHILMDRVAQNRKWEAVPRDEVALAQFNDPFTPPWKRLNEVSVAVRAKERTKQ